MALSRTIAIDGIDLFVFIDEIIISIDICNKENKQKIQIDGERENEHTITNNRLVPWWWWAGGCGGHVWGITAAAGVRLT